MTAPNTSVAPESTAPAIAGAPGAAPIAPAPDPAIIPIGRGATRAAILAEAGIAAADPLAPKLAGDPAAAPKAGEAAPAAAVDAKDAAKDAAKTAAKPEEGIELKPEVGDAPAGTAVKLRFRNAAGEYTASAIPSDHKIELEVNGKKYVKDFAGVARLAVDGIANQQHANENRQIKTQVIPRYESQISTLQEQLDTMVALNREILADEGRYAERRQEFQRLNSPEERAVRAERALVDERTSREQQTTSQRVAEYYSTNILPALHDVLAGAATVTDEEALGRIALDTRDWVVDGAIPPQRYPEFAAYLRGPFATWAKAHHAKNEAASTARRETETRAAAERGRQVQAQLDTREVGNAMRPAAAAAAPSAGGPVSTQPPRNRAEARRQIMSDAAASAG